MKAKHQRPQMRPAMLGSAAPGRSDHHVAICGIGDANPLLAQHVGYGGPYQSNGQASASYFEGQPVFISYA